ncbi:MAG: Ig-like domain-containing protein [Angustibacter sp.]
MQVSPMRRRGRAARSVVALLTAIAVTACQSPRDETVANSTTPQVPTSAPAPAQIAITPDDGTTRVRPDRPVRVTVIGGSIRRVRLIGGQESIPGELDAARATWTSSQNLKPGTRYQVRADAVNPAGLTATSVSTLTTMTAPDTATYDLLPSDGGTVGVGMPVALQFVSAVDEDRQDDIERRVSITTSPRVDGAWGWLDGRQLVWRPSSFWQPGTRVSVRADIAGVETQPGLWTDRNATSSFTIGPAMVSTVDVQRHTMTVRRDGEVLRTIPVTTGKAGFLTREGIKVILSREESRQMDAETTGIAKDDPEYYNIDVKYAMRLTWSGEFVHAAPWSVGSQGRDNVSHGCTGMSTENARWLFGTSRQGDVVRYINSPRSLENSNGYTMWNMSLADWAERSALVS